MEMRSYQNALGRIATVVRYLKQSTGTRHITGHQLTPGIGTNPAPGNHLYLSEVNDIYHDFFLLEAKV